MRLGNGKFQKLAGERSENNAGEIQALAELICLQKQRNLAPDFIDEIEMSTNHKIWEREVGFEDFLESFHCFPTFGLCPWCGLDSKKP